MPERWIASQSALQAAARAPHHYDNSVSWDNGAHCTGSLRPGTRALGDLAKSIFPNLIRSVGGYNCRPNTANTSTTSLHGLGRAADLMMTYNGDTSRAGDAVANWLLTNAADLGIQEIIWTRSIWSSTNGFREYTGPSSHTDHIHVGLSTASANQLPNIQIQRQQEETSSIVPVIAFSAILIAAAIWYDSHHE